MYIALDIGGTHIRVAFSSDLKDLAGTIKRHVNVSVSGDYTKDLDCVLTAVQKIREDEATTLYGVGVGFPGVMDTSGKIVVCANIPGWVGHNLGRDLEASLGCKVLVENDDTIAAFVEATFGHGVDKDFIYHTWGTGFGGAKIEQANDKTTVRQFEAGHQIIVWNNGRLCGCGQTGCAEAYVGGGNIQKYYGKPASELSEEEWDEVLTHLVHTLLNTLVVNPAPLIVLGGGIAINQKHRLPIIREKLRERLALYPMPDIRITDHDDDLGLYGAFGLLEEKLG